MREHYAATPRSHLPTPACATTCRLSLYITNVADAPVLPARATAPKRLLPHFCRAKFRAPPRLPLLRSLSWRLPRLYPPFAAGAPPPAPADIPHTATRDFCLLRTRKRLRISVRLLVVRLTSVNRIHRSPTSPSLSRRHLPPTPHACTIPFSRLVGPPDHDVLTRFHIELYYSVLLVAVRCGA